MLRYFFEDTGNGEKNARNRALFQGMKITEAGEEYTGHMGMYPVVNLTLKSAEADREMKMQIERLLCGDTLGLKGAVWKRTVGGKTEMGTYLNPGNSGFAKTRPVTRNICSGILRLHQCKMEEYEV